SGKNLWAAPNLLLQKLPSREFLLTTLVDVTHLREGERSGLLMMGRNYSYIAVTRSAAGLRVVHVVCIDAAKGGTEKETAAEVKSSYVYLRVSVVGDAICAFSYSVDGKR